ncbi:hypothetical protein ASE12_14615 [Aeromicrobium sp. Root236]|uniref:carboxypeptidase-like regulatory domain-containing protein n=1 Tax=Aeromicrobium sp. Root236 TaxID=1736498 RepID=UPI0006F2BBB2|nr:carboxypeptidase-like regulatory domain-containing protein [Aeromicrobium sp. Root236]KRC65883.1 hypothetical protein ASE12_14615 [Aeromicrobium sp. Root236]
MRPTTTVALSAVVTGTISDPSGYPLAGITVALFTEGRDQGTRLDTTITDDVGGYRFTRRQPVAGDDYRVEATDHTGAHVFTRLAVTIDPARPTPQDLTMPVAGYVQGTVVSDEQPATDMCVTASGAHATGAAYVSAKGTFRIGGLPPGEYAVTFQDADLTAREPIVVSVAAGRETTIEDQVIDLGQGVRAAR